MLRPPCRQDHSMGPLLPNRVSVQGKSWRESSTDIAIAGLGWVGVGVSGQAALDLWTYKGLPLSLICSQTGHAWKLLLRM